MEKEFPPEPTAELTERELEILKLLATGCSNKEIAQRLVISSNTVKVHLRNIFAKIGASSRTEAAMYAVNNGLAQHKVVTPNSSENEARTQVIQKTDEAFVKRTKSLRWIISLLSSMLFLGMAGWGFYFTHGFGLNIGFKATTSPTLPPTPTALPRWKRMADMPTARSGLAVVAYDNSVYAIGGETLSGITGAVESYNLQSNSWQKRLSKPLAVTDINAAVIGGKIYVPGGRLAPGKATNVLDIYDPRLDQWEQGPPLPLSLSGYAMVAFEGRLYLFGGWDGEEYQNSVLVFDPSRNSWSVRTPMPTRRAFAGAAVVNESIYVIGGFDGSQILTNNEVYTPSQDEDNGTAWSKAADLPEGRCAMGVTSLTDIIYLLGGKSITETPITQLYFVPTTNLWAKLEEPAISIGEGIGLASLGNYLIVVGGRDGQRSINQIQAYQAIYTILLPSIK